MNETNEYFLNGRKMKTREEAYDHIAGALGFPEYFGKNLDALYDLLTEISAEVTLKNPASMLNSLGAYGCNMLKCFFDAAEENKNFLFKLK